jgi:hypothetical protein
MGDVFYLRLLLFHHPGRSYEDLHTVQGSLYSTFQAAAQAAGLLKDTNEGLLAMEDAIADYKSATQLRFLFVLLVVEGAPALDLWLRFCDNLSLDFAGNTLQPLEDRFRTHSHNRALAAIDLLLQEHGSSCTQCGLPAVRMLSAEVQSELDYFAPQAATLRNFVDNALHSMTPDQHAVYDTIFQDVYGPIPVNPCSCLHFLTGKAGRGNSFVVKALIAHV